MSAFVDALRINLRCPKCGVLNRPQAFLIELDQYGRASCNHCGAAWIEPLLKPAEAPDRIAR